MLQISFKRVKPGKVDKLRTWMRELKDRREEIFASFEQEGVRSEKAWLLEDDDGYVLVYAIEAEDLEQARRVYAESTLPIDLEHRAIQRDTLGKRVEPELLLDLTVDDMECDAPSDHIYSTGAHLRLRKPLMEDAPLRHKWFADPQVTRYLPLAGKDELPIEDIRDYLEMVTDSNRPVFDVSIELLDGVTIGSASYRDVVDGESAELSIVLGEAKARGRGLGREAMELMLDYGFDEMKLKHVWLVVRADNDVAVALFESLGFETAEVLEDAVVIDDVSYAKLRMELKSKDWKKGQTS
ncbi:GNAT family N-acetyltransferase [Persicimonas caeni]|uniref:GNAT family N-acetyltransferase n=1 Tax=Persicimonas caeni TaxID=2292766 RepID=A0A4Y6Q150_PERCE|nr:GNAT family N-acetyltransferase [Persicimonas caeni]QDG53957.1 GNAT family N-acetyltransferase [Persicimonas caeni]QED35178.1 GNAT family N-acetyltransferase [Persicimonas caeni]